MSNKFPLLHPRANLRNELNRQPNKFGDRSKSGSNSMVPASYATIKHHVSKSLSEPLPPGTHNKIHRHHHQKHIRDRDDRSPRSSNQLLQPSSNGEGQKAETFSSSGSRSHSRRPSLRGSVDDVTDLRSSTSREKRTVTEAELKEEIEKGVQRAAGLRNAITELNKVSNSTTRRLDNSYYSVLEKLSVLQGTINSLKNISTMTRQVNEEFKLESGNLSREIDSQINGFRDFETQEKRILELQERVEKGREKIKGLNQRVDVVRQRVGEWEMTEGAWKEQARKRWRLVWITIATCIGIIIAIIVFQYRPTKTPGPEVLQDANMSRVINSLPEVQGVKKATWSTNKAGGIEALGERRKKLKDNKEGEEILGEHPKLKLFDEL
ncbi:hypothetical protein F5884DRAFT_44231 [Xylogone sp. PMI_703]|nr:hypothetical protein F5884DRAFT_44231 [Xylogone sp. PMI_703]